MSVRKVGAACYPDSEAQNNAVCMNRNRALSPSSCAWGCGAALHFEAALKPEEDKSDQRNEDVAPKDDPRISRFEIVLGNHRLYMNSSSSPQKAGRAEDGRKAHVETSPSGDDTDQTHSEACEAELNLERTIGPADEACCPIVKENMKHRIVDVGDTN